MIRQLRRLALGLLLGALAGWLWLRRQQRAETMSEPAAPFSQGDDRIVLPTWTASPREEGSPVAGQIVLPEGVENATLAANGSESLGERPILGENGAEPAASDGGEVATAEAAPPTNGDITVLVTHSEDDTSARATEGAGSTIEGYCVRCKEQRPMVNVHPYTTANKRPALKGECGVCGAGMFKFIKE